MAVDKEVTIQQGSQAFLVLRYNAWNLDQACSSQESQHGLVVPLSDFHDWQNLCA